MWPQQNLQVPPIASHPVTWTEVAAAATVVGVLSSLGTVAYQVHKRRQAANYESLSRLTTMYEDRVKSRKNRWKKLKDAVTSNEETAAEIHDKQNSVDYLALRAGQSEPMYAIEHGVLEYELRCMALLNEMCRVASLHDTTRNLLGLSEAAEISYYQGKSAQLVALFEAERKVRRFTRPAFNHIMAFDVSEWFDQAAGEPTT